jgi:shikimate kinase
MADRNRASIAEMGVALWLDADLDTLWERVRHKDTRPLLRTPDPKTTLTEIFHTRRPIYAHAGLRLSIGADATIDDTTQDAVDALAADPTILERT